MARNTKKAPHECATYLFLEFKDVDDVPADAELRARLERAGRAISAFTEDYAIKKYGCEIARNEQYDADVNNMVHRTIKDLVGKESEVKQMLEALDADLYLEIVPYIRADSDCPKPILSLDRDIIEFLYKSGTQLDIDYYII